MFTKGKVYTTVGGWPAKILHIAGQTAMLQEMVVLHNAYTNKERIVEHMLDGTTYRTDDTLIHQDKDLYALTPQEYSG